MNKVKEGTVFCVDLPDVGNDTPGGSYITVARFDTRKAALGWLLDVHGMPADIAQFFISEV